MNVSRFDAAVAEAMGNIEGCLGDLVRSLAQIADDEHPQHVESAADSAAVIAEREEVERRLDDAMKDLSAAEQASARRIREAARDATERQRKTIALKDRRIALQEEEIAKMRRDVVTLTANYEAAMARESRAVRERDEFKHSTVPALNNEISRLTALVASYQACIAFYANERSWDAGMTDRGKRARDLIDLEDRSGFERYVSEPVRPTG